MHFEPVLVPLWLSEITILVTLLALGMALYTAPWRLLLSASERQHLFFGSVLVLALIWSMSVTVKATLSFHLLLVASVVLLLGLSFGVLAALLALAARHLLGGGEWAMFGVDALCTVLAPALVPVLAVRFIRRISVAPLFAFTLGAGFLGGAVSVVAAALAALLVLELAQQQVLLAAAWDQVALLPLLMFGEGFINGTVVTALAVFHPEWVRSFTEPE